MTPRTTRVAQDDTHRLVPLQFSAPEVLARVSPSPQDLGNLVRLESATSDEVLAAANLLPGIQRDELVFGVANAAIVNAAFTHAAPSGSRFNGPDRGAWYAAFEIRTALQEVAYHKAAELRETGWTEPETFTLDDFLADFRADFHDLREDSRFNRCLDPISYADSQGLARRLITGGSNGIVYPSVRTDHGTCLVCFRPALVLNVRLGARSSISFTGSGSPPQFG